MSTEKCSKCGIDHQGIFCPMEAPYEIEHMPMIRTTKSIVTEAIAANNQWWIEQIKVYEEYIELLGQEIQELSGMGFLHGWTSSRVEIGKLMREKIQSLKQSVEKGQ